MIFKIIHLFSLNRRFSKLNLERRERYEIIIADLERHFQHLSELDAKCAILKDKRQIIGLDGVEE